MNLATGNNRARRSRAKVENALGVQIWPETAAEGDACTPFTTPLQGHCSSPVSQSPTHESSS